MLIKVSAFHVYTHHDSDKSSIENCKWCIMVVENQHAEHQIAVEVQVSPISCSPVLGEPIFVGNIDLFIERPFQSCLFSRPPPSILSLG